MAAMMKRSGFFVLALGLLCPVWAQNAGDGSSTAADEAEMSALEDQMEGEVEKRRALLSPPTVLTPAADDGLEPCGEYDSEAERITEEEVVSDDATAEATVIMTLPPGSKMPPVRPSPGSQKPPPQNVNTPGPQKPAANINKPTLPPNQANVNKPQPQGAQTYRKEPPATGQQTKPGEQTKPGDQTKPGGQTKPGQSKPAPGREKEKGQKPANLPPNAVENPHRPGTWGEVGPDGKFKERWGFHGGTPGKPGWGGKDHVHVDRGPQHLPPGTPYPR